MNALALYALGAFVSTSEVLLEGRSRKAYLILFEATVVLALVLMSLLLPERWPRVVLVSIAASAICGYASLSIRAKAKREGFRNGPGILSFMFGVGAVAYLGRALLFATHGFALVHLGQLDAEAVADLVDVILFPAFNLSILAILMARVEREVTGKVLELGESRKNLQMLYEAFAETAGSVDLEELLPSILDILHKSLQVDAAVLYLYDQQSRDLLLVAQRGLDSAALDGLLGRQKGTLVVEQSFESGRAMSKLLEGFPEGQLRDSLRALGLSVFAGVPIVARGETLGALGVSFKDAEALDEGKMNLLETLARQLGSVIRAASLHAELERANARLDILASTDSLTHLANRRTALRVIEREIARATRLHGKMAVIMCDLDHFKDFNDRYGHDCGDYVLSRTATIIAESLRSTDLAARWGGEEFLIILGSADPEGVGALAERIRRNVESASWEYSGRRLSVTITLGVSICPPEVGADISISRADEALYEGKRQGRNRVGIHQCEDLPPSILESYSRNRRTGDDSLETLPQAD